MLGGLVSMFAVEEGTYAYILPIIVMVTVLIYKTIKVFIDIDAVSSDSLGQEIRLPLTFFAYSLFLIAFAGIIIGVSLLVESWKYKTIIAAYTALITAYGGLIGFNVFIISVIFMTTLVRNSCK